MGRLEEETKNLTAIAWEQEYERRDLVEDMQSLQQLLRDNLALRKTEDLPWWLKSVLESETDEKIQRLEITLRAQRSRNWELTYYCRDLEEDLRKLEMQLQNSIPAADIEHPPWRPRTAMEEALAARIKELEAKIRNPKGRGRSNSV